MRTIHLATTLFLFSALSTQAQSTREVAALPSAPAPRINLSPQTAPPLPANSAPQTTLTRMEAEQMALKNNPRVSIVRLLALAQHQVVREARSAELPTANGAVTAEKALDGSRISAGTLTSSRLLTHAGAGGNFTQLITDFGKHTILYLRKSSKNRRRTPALWRRRRRSCWRRTRHSTMR